MKNITLISASYNTPDVTEQMLKTFTSFHTDVPILISENSSDTITENILKEHNIPYIRNIGGLHGPSVDLLLNNINTDYALLVDTDVLFLKSHADILEQFISMDLTLMGEIVADRGGKRLYKRVNPWHCFINVKKIKEHNIKFYDMMRLRERGHIRYDVGSSFFEDIRKKRLNIGHFNGSGIYYIHFEGMSWRTQRYQKDNISGDIDNSKTDTHNDVNLFMYGKHIEETFKKETEKYKILKINYHG